MLSLSELKNEGTGCMQTTEEVHQWREDGHDAAARITQPKEGTVLFLSGLDLGKIWVCAELETMFTDRKVLNRGSNQCNKLVYYVRSDKLKTVGVLPILTKICFLRENIPCKYLSGQWHGVIQICNCSNSSKENMCIVKMLYIKASLFLVIPDWQMCLQPPQNGLDVVAWNVGCKPSGKNEKCSLRMR